jgi:hypothetical protein
LRQFPPSRIVCLTEETVETLYLLGEQDRIVGVSGYAVRPPQVRREKPRVSAFTSADIPKILALEPDLVLTFSDLQAEIAAELIRAGITVHAFNQRDIAGIFTMIRTVGALVGATTRLGCDPGGTKRSNRRDQIGADTAARTRSTDRWPRCNSRRTGTSELIELKSGSAARLSVFYLRLAMNDIHCVPLDPQTCRAYVQGGHRAAA